MQEQGFTPGSRSKGSSVALQVAQWLGLILLSTSGLVVGTVAGYLYFSTKRPVYSASGLVQIAQPASADASAPVHASASQISLIMRSQKVLRMAVEQGRLSERMAPMPTDAIIQELMMTEDLSVETLDEGATTCLVSINYVSQDAELCAEVVNSIISAYEGYVAESQAENAQEPVDLLAESLKLKNQIQDLQRQNPDLDLSELSNPYEEEKQRVMEEISRLKIQREKLRGILTHVEEARKAGRSEEALILMLDSATADHSTNHRMGNDGASDSGSEDLFSLKVELESLKQTLGPSHPKVLSIQQQIERTEAQGGNGDSGESEEKNNVTGGETSLEIRMDALKEEYASLESQQRGLKQLADQAQAKSTELLRIHEKYRTLSQELSAVEKSLEKTKDAGGIKLLQPGQRTVKILNAPTIGGFQGPYVATYLVLGALAGLVTGLALGIVLFMIIGAMNRARS